MVQATPSQLAACFKKLQQEDMCEDILVASNSIDYQDVSFATSLSDSNNMPAPTPMSMADVNSGGGYGGAGFGGGGRSAAKPKRTPNPIASGARPAKMMPKKAARTFAGQTEEEQDSVKPVRLLIVLEPSESATGEGSGSIIDFQATYGCIG